MKILVEIDLGDTEPNDVYKPNSSWFNKPGYIDISEEYLNPGLFRFKYIGQVHEHNAIPRPFGNIV